jgi:hypothetical protein
MITHILLDVLPSKKPRCGLKHDRRQMIIAFQPEEPNTAEGQQSNP